MRFESKWWLAQPVRSMIPSLIVLSLVGMDAWAQDTNTQNSANPVESSLAADVEEVLELSPARQIQWLQHWRPDDQSARTGQTVALMLANESESEPVRYAAVCALSRMLAEEVARNENQVCVKTVCCPKRRGLIGRLLSRVFGASSRRQHQVSYVLTGPPLTEGHSPCCAPAVREALRVIATGDDSNRRTGNGSSRLSAAAMNALSLCDRLADCTSDLPPGPAKPRGPAGDRQHLPVPEFKIEEPPAGSSGFEPLAQNG